MARPAVGTRFSMRIKPEQRDWLEARAAERREALGRDDASTCSAAVLRDVLDYAMTLPQNQMKELVTSESD